MIDALKRYKRETLRYNGEAIDTAYIPPLSSAGPGESWITHWASRHCLPRQSQASGLSHAQQPDSRARCRLFFQRRPN